ncbi:MAG: 30S ribosomal protein S15 [Candidatus Bathyarchaeota archaeon B23]|nr:MAG: 30S ribosomal protein S15 [Candidatus Bathyarchaeota archaeon B23]
MGKLAYVRGRSRSKRPVSKRPPNWVVYKPEEVKALIIKLAREGKPPSEIGNILRDEYGVPLVKPLLGCGIVKVLREAGLAPKIPEDLYNLMVRATRIKRHMERNPKDFHNKRALQLVESKIYRLARYYKEKGILPRDWRYKYEIVQA